MKNQPSYADLSLFLTLYNELSLSRAAEKEELSVSAASHRLSQLRKFFDDDLFIKTGTGVIPTHKAHELFPEIQLIVGDIERLTAPRNFDLSTVEATVKIGCVDNAAFSLLSGLLDEIIAKAPNVTLKFLSLSGKMDIQRLRSNELDFIVSPMIVPPSEEYCELVIGENHFVLVGGRGHPLVKLAKECPDGVSNDDVSRYSFVDVMVRKGTLTLRETVFPEWKDFQSRLQTSFFLPFVKLLEDNRLLMVLPDKTASILASNHEVEIIPTATKSVVNWPKVIWHRSMDKNPLNQWIRAVIFKKAKEATGTR